jgi:hypothetical protein
MGKKKPTAWNNFLAEFRKENATKYVFCKLLEVHNLELFLTGFSFSFSCLAEMMKEAGDVWTGMSVEAKGEYINKKIPKVLAVKTAKLATKAAKK